MKIIELENRKKALEKEINELANKIKTYKEKILTIKLRNDKIRKKYNNLNLNLDFDKTDEYIKQVSELKALVSENRKINRFLNKECEKFENELKVLKDKYRFLESFEYFNRNEIFEVITYLVSKMENQEYILHTLPVLISVDLSFKYIFVFLAPDAKKELALYEVRNRFKEIVDKSAIEENNISNYYLQLAIYKDSDRDLIAFDELNNNEKLYSHMKSISIIPHTKIFDIRFSYIYDFLRLIINERLNSNSLLTSEDIYNLANQFIASKKGEKVTL